MISSRSVTIFIISPTHISIYWFFLIKYLYFSSSNFCAVFFKVLPPSLLYYYFDLYYELLFFSHCLHKYHFLLSIPTLYLYLLLKFIYFFFSCVLFKSKHIWNIFFSLLFIPSTPFFFLLWFKPTNLPTCLSFYVLPLQSLILQMDLHL